MAFWPDDLTGWTDALQGVAVAAGGLWAVRTFASAQRQKAAQILLEVEREFREVRPTCDRVTSAETYDAFYRPCLARLAAREPLDDQGLERRDELDRALRFFYFCCVLNSRLDVDLATLKDAYYFYLREFVDAETRPELRSYVEEWYPRLFAWIRRQNLGTF